MRGDEQDKIKCGAEHFAALGNGVVFPQRPVKEEYTAKQVLVIYRSRWQIELLFKRIKQHFKVTKIRPSSEKYAKSLNDFTNVVLHYINII